MTGASDITEEGVLTNEPSKDEEKGVPSFWLTTIASNSVIGTLIAEEDVPALEALTNITVDYAEDFSAFTLNFHFNENDFFTNTVLKKKYAVEPDLLDERSPSLSDIEGDEIQWKKGKDLTKQEITKKQKAKGGRNKGQVRTVTRTVPKPSFFHFFDTPKQHGEEEEEEEQPEEEDEQEGGPRTKFNIDEDYDIGHIIRTSIIPEAILWFTGEAEDDEGMFDFGEEDVSMMFLFHNSLFNQMILIRMKMVKVEMMMRKKRRRKRKLQQRKTRRRVRRVALVTLTAVRSHLNASRTKASRTIDCLVFLLLETILFQCTFFLSLASQIFSIFGKLFDDFAPLFSLLIRWC